MNKGPQQHEFQTSGARLTYFEWGSPAGPVVLLIHATGFHARCWDQVVKLLPDDYHVYAVDMRGHGRSENVPPYVWRTFGEDLNELVEHLDLSDAVGVGHSMGSFLSVSQQARFQSHAALALYSYSNRGLPELLSKDELEIAQDPTAVWKRLPKWVERRFGSPYPQVSRQHAGASEAAFGTGTAEGAGVAALRKCGTNLVAQPGLLTLYPGGYAPFSEDVTCPVFVATGDGDLSPRSAADGAVPNAVEVVDYLLEDSRHAHNVARTRQRLWARTARWVRSVVPGAAANESR